jgi:hypothetical protein
MQGFDMCGRPRCAFLPPGAGGNHVARPGQDRGQRCPVQPAPIVCGCHSRCEHERLWAIYRRGGDRRRPGQNRQVTLAERGVMNANVLRREHLMPDGRGPRGKDKCPESLSFQAGRAGFERSLVTAPALRALLAAAPMIEGKMTLATRLLGLV